MGGLTWRQLGAPEYLMTFVEGFLISFLPAVGLGQAASSDGASISQVATQVPSVVVLIGAVLVGLLNGDRSLRNLRAPAPEPRPAPEPKP